MTVLAIVLSSVLIIGGLRLMTLSPAVVSLFFSGSLALTLAGIGGFAAVYVRGSGVRKRLGNVLKMVLGVLAFFLMFFGVVFALLSLAGAFNWPEFGRQTLGLALVVVAGALSQLLMMGAQTDPGQEGFYFITGEKCSPHWGFTGLRYVYEGDRNGIPIRASVRTGSADKRGIPRYVVELVCLIDNPHRIELLAHVDNLPGRLSFSRLPRIGYVPFWRGYVVRGAPSGIIPDMISPFRKSPVTIFSEPYGFERVSVSGNAVRGRFVLRGSGEKYRLGDIVDGLAFFAGHFN